MKRIKERRRGFLYLSFVYLLLSNAWHAGAIDIVRSPNAKTSSWNSQRISNDGATKNRLLTGASSAESYPEIEGETSRLRRK